MVAENENRLPSQPVPLGRFKAAQLRWFSLKRLIEKLSGCRVSININDLHLLNPRYQNRRKDCSNQCRRYDCCLKNCCPINEDQSPRLKIVPPNRNFEATGHRTEIRRQVRNDRLRGKISKGVIDPCPLTVWCNDAQPVKPRRIRWRRESGARRRVNVDIRDSRAPQSNGHSFDKVRPLKGDLCSALSAPRDRAQATQGGWWIGR